MKVVVVVVVRGVRFLQGAFLSLARIFAVVDVGLMQGAFVVVDMGLMQGASVDGELG